MIDYKIPEYQAKLSTLENSTTTINNSINSKRLITNTIGGEETYLYILNTEFSQEVNPGEESNEELCGYMFNSETSIINLITKDNRITTLYNDKDDDCEIM